DLPVLVDELVDGDDPLGLVPDVDDHLGRGDFEYGPLDDFTFRDIPEAAIVKVEEARVFLRIDRIVRGVESGHLLRRLLSRSLDGSGRATSFGIVRLRVVNSHAKRSPPRSCVYRIPAPAG